MNRSNKSINYYIVLAVLLLYGLRGWIIAYLPLKAGLINILYEIPFAVMLVQLFSFKSSQPLPRNIWWLVAYIAWCAFATLVNFYPPLDFFLYTRYAIHLLIFIVFFWNAPLRRDESLSIVRWTTAVMIAQIPISLFNWLFFGIAEYRVGSIAFGSGGMAALFPLIGGSYFLAYFLLKKRSLWVFVLFYSFIVVGLASGKRGIHFTFLMLVVVGFMLHWLFVCNIKAKIPLLLLYGFLIFISVPLLLFSLGKSQRFERLENIYSLGDKLDYIAYVVNEYEDRGSYRGATSGRIANNSLMLEQLTDDRFDAFWFGTGPMSCTSRYADIGMERYLFGYGSSGWIIDILSVGVPAMIFSTMFYLSWLWWLIKRFRTIPTNSREAVLCFGSMLALLSMLFNNFMYNEILVASCQIQMLVFGGCVLLRSPKASEIFAEPQDGQLS